MTNSTFHIGELSNLFNISVDSIRYYEKKGLICPTRNENNGYREYSLDDFQTLVMIRELLGLDFHKEQISEFLKNRNISTTMEMFDLVQNFILFDNNIKKIARHQQYFAINKSMDRINGKDGSSSKEKGADCQPDSVFASRAE
mgnify:CR=1 FL=1